ncbi:unnamed protein product [Acanthoscelides obtectus]|uniref:Uncharacterized protein n=1 Tax=Acanthoscelides obtectus TaxID=200917 RepID=A0A9P0K315_ACAOB|nr:unnamed protein product [Acanthoscelides obtectus]CAK1640360.1 Calcium-binding mitochondrial carrier protein SCaMC-2 [Acanthoscelides obtectus]
MRLVNVLGGSSGVLGFSFWMLEYLDIGEDMNVPDDFTQSEMQTGMWWRHLAAGGIAGAVSRTCTAPLDRLKVFLQVQPSKQKIKDCFIHMVKEGGVTGLWRGNGINVLKIAPESALKFAAYEQVKRLIKGDSKNQLAIYERFMAGALAGAISQTAIYPMEVLKTRLALRKTGQYKSIADAAYKIYVTEGLMSFYRGYIPNILGKLTLEKGRIPKETLKFGKHSRFFRLHQHVLGFLDQTFLKLDNSTGS